MKAVDTDGNGHISYNGQTRQLCLPRKWTLLMLPLPEFRTFVHETERELLALFKSIDYNDDGKITKPELRAALSRAGMAVPNSSLDNFFTEVDTNNDGHISFEEWRYVFPCCSRLDSWQTAALQMRSVRFCIA
jgi:solute carrier family 25 phosphate transporter 23/24/25/41